MNGVEQCSFYPEEPVEQILYWLWLVDVLGTAHPYAGRLLEVFGDAEEMWRQRTTETFRAIVRTAAATRAALPDKTPQAYRPYLESCRKKGIQILTPDRADYPQSLLSLPDLPLVLYCTGDVRFLNQKGLVGMVGSRRPTTYGISAAARIGKELARGGAILVSGLAYGLDSEGHRAAVLEHCPTIGIQGVPIDKVYPTANASLRKRIEENGCVISEYPPSSSGVGKVGFLQRNRLIAGISGALLVVEAKEESGTMSTVSYAERYGVPVFAVPGSIFSENSGGTNRLIQEGRAQMAVGSADILLAIGLEQKSSIATDEAAISPQEKIVLAQIGAEPSGVEKLAQATGLGISELLGVLMRLELAGRVIVLPGKQYILR